MSYKIKLTLKSDTTFGRGDGVAGLIDVEVEHDEFGLPFLRGRALKGLLAEECANILFSLQLLNKREDWEGVAQKLFGFAGSILEAEGKMHVGDATLPEELKQAIAYEILESKSLTPDEILASLTTIRRQTAITEHGAPKENSLRSIRVILRKTVFESTLMFDENYKQNSREIILLGTCCAALQRVGLGRNRGRGKVKTSLYFNNEDITETLLNNFEGNIS